jgi:hypothetical protein
MNEQEKIILNNIKREVEENNKILKSMRTGSRWSKFFKIVYWVTIATLGLFLWSLIEPAVSGFSSIFDKIVKTEGDLSKSVSEISDSLSTIKESTSGISGLFEKVKK